MQMIKSKITMNDLEKTIKAYWDMADEAKSAGNNLASCQCIAIADELAKCAKYTHDYYNSDANSDGVNDENTQGNRS